MKMKYAISIGDFTDDQNRADAYVEAFRRSKLKAMELSFFPLVDPESELSRIHVETARRIKRENVAEIASVHLPFMGGNKTWDASLLDEAARKDVSERLFKMISEHSDLLAKDVTMHASMEPPLAEHPARLECVCRTITELLPLAKEFGFSLNIEYLPRKCIGNCVEELDEIINRFDPKYVNMCMDVNHVMDKYNELPDIITHFAPRMRTLHINDYDGIDEKHWFPGQGVINWGAVMKAIKAIDHDVTLIMECTKQLEVFGRPADPYFRLKQTENAFWYMENSEEIEQRLKDFTIKY